MSELTTKQIRTFEAACFLKTIKVGDTVSERTIESIREFLGDLLDKLPEPCALVLGVDFFIKTGDEN